MTQRICRLLVLTLAPVLLSNFAWAQAINLVCSHRYGDAAYILDIPKQTVRDVQRGLQPTVIRWDDGVIVTERKLRDVATKPPLAAVEVTHFNRLTAGFSEWTEFRTSGGKRVAALELERLNEQWLADEKFNGILTELWKSGSCRSVLRQF